MKSKIHQHVQKVPRRERNRENTVKISNNMHVVTDESASHKETIANLKHILSI